MLAALSGRFRDLLNAGISLLVGVVGMPVGSRTPEGSRTLPLVRSPVSTLLAGRGGDMAPISESGFMVVVAGGLISG